MPQIPERSNFEPTQNSLSKWLAARKAKLQISNTSIPSFYSDYNFSEDVRWFWIGVIGELFGIALIFIGAAKKGKFFFGLAVCLAIALFLCDLFLANRLHRNIGKKCWIDNMLYIIGNSDPVRRKELTLKREDGNGLDILLKIFIILIGIVKLAGVAGLGTFKNPAVYIPVVVLYGVVCYIHLFHTGYYLAYIRTEKLFKKDYTDFGKGENKSRSLEHPFETLSPLVNIPIRIGSLSEIDFDSSNTDVSLNKYKLKTKGILVDEDITLLMAGQQPANRDKIAYECRNHQVTNMSVALA